MPENPSFQDGKGLDRLKNVAIVSGNWRFEGGKLPAFQTIPIVKHLKSLRLLHWIV
jgi:hypothetical protein